MVVCPSLKTVIPIATVYSLNILANVNAQQYVQYAKPPVITHFHSSLIKTLTSRLATKKHNQNIHV